MQDEEKILEKMVDESNLTEKKEDEETSPPKRKNKRKIRVSEVTSLKNVKLDGIKYESKTVTAHGQIVWLPEDKDIVAVCEKDKYLYFNKNAITTSEDDKLGDGRIVELEYPRDSVKGKKLDYTGGFKIKDSKLEDTDESEIKDKEKKSYFRKPKSVKLTAIPSPVSTQRNNSNIVIEPVNLKNASSQCETSEKSEKKDESETKIPVLETPIFKYKELLNKPKPGERTIKSYGLKPQIMKEDKLELKEDKKAETMEDETPFIKIKDSKAEENKEEIMDVQTPLPKSKLSVCTWNINHLSDTTEKEKAETKENGLISIFEDYSPDVLVLQEINLYSELTDKKWAITPTKAKKEIVYKWSMGPLLKTANTLYTHKYGSQCEYYAIAYNEEKVTLIEEMVLLTYKTWDKVVTKDSYTPIEIKGGDSSFSGVEWTEHRPLVVAILQVKETGTIFAIGIVHTSPSFNVEISTWEYLRAMQARFRDIPWMLAGDWYVKSDTKIPMQPIKGSKTFSTALEDFSLHYVAPGKNTNYPKDHEREKKKTSSRKAPEGMIADYIVTDECWETVKESKVKLVRTDFITEKALKSNEVSDHSPVIALFELDPNKKK